MFGLCHSSGCDVSQVLVLLLLHEKGKGEDSWWWPALQYLPEKYDQTINWTAPELEEISGTNLHGLTLRLLEQIDGDFEELRKGIFSKYPEIFLAEKFSLEDYKYGLSSLWLVLFCFLTGAGSFLC